MNSKSPSNRNEDLKVSIDPIICKNGKKNQRSPHKPTQQRYTAESNLKSTRSIHKVMTAQQKSSNDTKQVIFSPQKFVDCAATNPAALHESS